MLEKRGQQILMILKPEETETHEDGTKILDNIVVNKQSLTANLFGSETVSEIFVSVASFDSDNRLHGFAELTLPPRDRIRFGFTFDDVTSVRGNFVPGNLSGIVLLELQDYRTVYLTVKNGVAHGPAVIAGFVPILPVKVYFQSYIKQTE